MGKKRIVGLAYAQSCIDGFDASNALDGKANTFWKATPYYQWWLMDCGSVHSIESITVDTGMPSGEFCRYAIDYSCDRINWTELCEKTDDLESLDSGDCYHADINARYIRITLTYCSSGDAVTLRNVTVTGEPCGIPGAVGSSLVQSRTRANTCDASEGFEARMTDELEPGWIDNMLISSSGGAWLAFYRVELGELRGQQLCGMFFFPDKDKALHVCVELRLDSKDGPLIGSMNVARQYTPWLQLACDLEPGDYGTRDVYLCIPHIDAPQQLGILWLNIKKRPQLSDEIIDHADESVSADGPYRVFFGNLHSHTGFTDGSRTPAYAYDYARNVAKLDFLGVTEHSNLFDDSFDASLSRKWRDLKRIAEDKTVDGEFLAIMGSETTWYNQFGHMNIYGADFFLNPYEVKYNDTAVYYKTLKQFPRVINQWNHPWSCGNRHLDMFEPYDPELDRVMYTIELNSVEIPEENSLMYYIHALDQGWHVSPVGSQDNHRENWGTENDIRTGVVLRKLTKADFYDAVRKHRTYYTSAKHLAILFYANGFMMGSTISKANEVEFDISIRNEETDAELDHAEIIGKNGKVLSSYGLSGHSAQLHASVAEASPYYFLKVIQKDKKFAVTAPVWIDM